MGKFFTKSEWIQLTVHERVARVTLNRPDERNAADADEKRSSYLEKRAPKFSNR
jgi:hypothetical protein